MRGQQWGRVSFPEAPLVSLDDKEKDVLCPWFRAGERGLPFLLDTDRQLNPELQTPFLIPIFPRLGDSDNPLACTEPGARTTCFRSLSSTHGLRPGWAVFSGGGLQLSCW